ncbi:tRNA wybutosine-synthesizing protein 2/3/4 [Cucurbita moschata]|uniref:tRNA wybutosine-synthesizing protein 2/3/4 n=1 Tax=Cucurbita moschata TaxID=3662 RepID=A0A6J1EJK3_CUCMO|nr:tRNA wybutosine-synthesizing protein 2/3/4 [Cucurbita moschata]
MEFEKRKAATMASLGSTETDKSPKGSLDTPIIPLINTLNNHPSYFTTSSCSGRISILSQPVCSTSAAAPKPRKKALGGSWLFVSHEFADPNSVIDLLFRSPSTNGELSELVFRFEPLIIAIECKDLGSAQDLVSTAISSGFRESGITSASKRVIIAIRCSIRMEVPLGTTEKIMVSPEYVRYLVDVANEKMVANKKRTDGFLKALQSRVSAVTNVSQTCQGISLREAMEEANDLLDSKEHSCADEEDCGALEGGNRNANSGSSEACNYSLSVEQMGISGEPMAKLFIWGHSATTVHNKVIAFGGFGGMGRHARRNDLLQLDMLSCTLQTISVEDSPSPRLGHTSSLVGDCLYVIGGRTDPTYILNDVWVFDITQAKWTLLKCTGSSFSPRHRHAAAAVGSKIYVFGGLENDRISSSLIVLNTDSHQWKEIQAGGDQPCGRHSHSMVSYGSHLYMFGGYDGEKAFGDLYSFNTENCYWKKENMAGRTPNARFSHAMFVYENYIGIIGGCPVSQSYQEFALLDLQHRFWRHVSLNCTGKELFVRCTANVVGDDLVLVGGGASCYAFGTNFSEPVKIRLRPLISSEVILGHPRNTENLVTRPIEELEKESRDPECLLNGNAQTFNEAFGFNIDSEKSNSHEKEGALYWVLKIERNYAKLGKDILKRYGWLDMVRKVSSRGSGTHIFFPVNGKFCDIFDEKKSWWGDQLEPENDFHVSELESWEGGLTKKCSYLKALNILRKCGATKLVDEVVDIKTAAKSPYKKMSEALSSLLKHNGLSEGLLEELPTRWERLGDIVVLPVTSFKDPTWDTIGEELWPMVAKSLGTSRLARQGRVASTGTRDSNLEILMGDNGWVDHRENGITYSFDATKCMFSWGNLSEKLRMAHLDCKDETVVDLFAGIGYFVLPFLVGAKAKLVYACEWNPHAIEALKRNLQANCVSNRCIVLEGDNRETAPKGVADRVCLGLLPTSEGSWVTAVRALRIEGGTLHVHGNVKDSEEELWTQHLLHSITEIAKSEGHCWDVSVEHTERVKWYAPHIRHLVVDVRCKRIQQNS